MVNKGALAAVVVLLALGGAGVAYALTRKGGGGAPVTVVVKDSAGAPIAGAEVILAGVTAGPSGVTDTNGKWVSPGIPAGSYLVTVTKSGYEIFQKETVLNPPQTVPVTLTLFPPPVLMQFAFVSFAPGSSACVSTWNNPNTTDISAVCFVTVKNSLNQTVSIGQAAMSIAAGATSPFDVLLGSVSGLAILPPGTYEFTTFVDDAFGRPLSVSHVETDTVA